MTSEVRLGDVDLRLARMVYAKGLNLSAPWTWAAYHLAKDVLILAGELEEEQVRPV